MCSCMAKECGVCELLRDVFPPHLDEDEEIYKQRCQRSWYVPYLAEILNSIIGGLFKESLEFCGGEDGEDPDEFYEELFKDCSPPGGDKQKFIGFLKEQISTALKLKTAWTLVDFPEAPEGLRDGEYSKGDEERAGLDKAYVCVLEPESVLDWYEDPKSGQLQWVIVHGVDKSRKEPGAQRDRTIETWTIYYEDRWERYQVAYADDEGVPDGDKQIPGVEGLHSFGKVPIVRMDVGSELWAGNKLLSIAIAHFTLRNALTWAELKSLFPVPVSYKTGMHVMNPASHNADRDVDQVVGQGHVLRLAEGDDFKFVGPDSAPYGVALEDLSMMRDEMHRVVHQMAMSVDNSGAALQRSGDSKALDYQLTAILFMTLAEIVKEHGLRILETVAAGRKEKDPTEWLADGMSKYNELSLDSLLSQAETVDTVSIPSETFKKIWCMRVASRLLVGAIDPEDEKAIKNELDKNITAEQFMAPLPLGPDDDIYDNDPPRSGSQGEDEKLEKPEKPKI